MRPPATGRPTHPAVVLALDCITGLQTARILAARGVPVIGVAADRRHFCARTRAVRRVVESPTAGDDLVVDARAARSGARRPGRGGPAVLVPCSDGSVLAISAGRERLAPWYRFVLPEHDVVELLMDKIGFAEHAQAHGLAIPPTRILRDRADAEAAAAALTYPAWSEAGCQDAPLAGGHEGQGLPRPWTRRAARDVRPLLGLGRRPHRPGLDRRRRIRPLLVQRLLRPVVRATGHVHRPEDPAVAGRHRHELPRRGGPQRRGARRDAPVLRQRRLPGLGYLEMKRDPHSGRHFIIEPNIGRPTGRSSIAERGGVELVMTAYRDALGEPLPAARTQRYRGVKWIYWRHDLQASIVAVEPGPPDAARLVAVDPRAEGRGRRLVARPAPVRARRVADDRGRRQPGRPAGADRRRCRPGQGLTWPARAAPRRRSPPARCSVASCAPSRRSIATGRTSSRS